MVNPIVGQYNLYCDTTKTGLIERPKWSGYGYSSLSIRSTDYRFIRNGTYYCGVSLRSSEMENSTSTDFQFDILYTLGSSL